MFAEDRLYKRGPAHCQAIVLSSPRRGYALRGEILCAGSDHFHRWVVVTMRRVVIRAGLVLVFVDPRVLRGLVDTRCDEVEIPFWQLRHGANPVQQTTATNQAGNKCGARVFLLEPGELLHPEVAERGVSKQVLLRVAEEALGIRIIRELGEVEVVASARVMRVRQKVTRRPLYGTAAPYWLECHEPIPRLASSDSSGF